MRKYVGYGVVLILVVGGFFWYRTTSMAAADAGAAALLTPAGETDLDGFATATLPNNVEFPRDLGPHNEYQTEWWYYTGNLETDNGRQFGYQFTIFRRAFSPEGGEASLETSEWRSNQLYFAHFTITDVEGEGFYPAEKFSRGAVGLAGAQASPYRVWIENWQAVENENGLVEIIAETDEVALNLTLTQTLPPILHGDGGLSIKGPGEGNASYYYSLIQQRSEGTVRVGSETFAVTGLSWKDHEYSTSALEEGATGWDWFSMQFEDGSALMFFEIRKNDGSLSDFSHGSFIAADGTITPLEKGSWELEILAEWTSPTSGATYPSGWQITIPSLDLVLEGTPLLKNQELNVSTIYWEGATEFSGTRGGVPVNGRGYVELTGYAQSMEGRL